MNWRWHVWTLEIRKLLSYRFDFWVNFFGKIGAYVVVSYFLWDAVYEWRGEDVIAGFHFEQIIFYSVLVPLLTRVVLGPESGFLSQDIYEGTLNRYIIYPVNVFGYKWMGHLAESTVAAVQMVVLVGLALLVVPQWTVRVDVSTQAMMLGVISALAAAYLYFYMASTLEMVAFWHDNVWSLLVMLRFIIFFLGGARVPLAFFPEEAVVLLAWTPFPSMAALPISTMMGMVSVDDWLAGMAKLAFWTLVMRQLTMLVYKRGRLQYSGVGI